MCKPAKSSGKGKGSIGVFGLVTAVAAGLFLFEVAKNHGTSAVAPAAKAVPASAPTPVAVHAGFPWGLTIAVALGVAVVAVAVVMVVRKLSEVLADRRLEAAQVRAYAVAERTKAEQPSVRPAPRRPAAEQVHEVPRQRELPPKQWQVFLERELSPGLYVPVQAGVVHAAHHEAAHQVRERVLRDAQQIMPGKYQAVVEPVSR